MLLGGRDERRLDAFEDDFLVDVLVAVDRIDDPQHFVGIHGNLLRGVFARREANRVFQIVRIVVGQVFKPDKVRFDAQCDLPHSPRLESLTYGDITSPLPHCRTRAAENPPEAKLLAPKQVKLLGEPASILRERRNCQAALGQRLTQKGCPMAAFWMIPPGILCSKLARCGRPAPYHFR